MKITDTRTGAGRPRARRGALTVVLGAAAICGASLVAPAARAEDQQLIETGSSLLYPLFNLWVAAYTKMHPGVQITPQSTGSGTGISQAIDGTVQIGGSDAYLSGTLSSQHKTMMNIPLAISSQMVNYNLPGMADARLRLSGPVLAAIYQGKITKWNDPAILAMNPGVRLPGNDIVTIHRTDGSGDTFIFTQYLAASTPGWANSTGYGTTINWPQAPGSIGAEGNPGMVNAMVNVPYSIAYIGISFKAVTATDNLGEAALQNRAGKFVLPSAETVNAAAGQMTSKTSKAETISLIFAPGDDSYPIINYEYAIVDSHQPNAALAVELKNFLSWTILPAQGNAPRFLDQVSFVALPSAIAKLSEAQINTIAAN